jgi:RNA polymerase sigma-70 factor (ECF subfamily)
MELKTPGRTEPGSEVARLYREEGPRLWRAIFAYTGDRELTDDAVAEAFAQVIRRGIAVRTPRAWVWRAAFKIAAGELKRRTEIGEMPPDPGIREIEDDRILPALGRLTPRQRVVIVLRYYAGYRPVEIASILDTAPSTVRVHLLRARRRLAQLLEEDDAT